MFPQYQEIKIHILISVQNSIFIQISMIPGGTLFINGQRDALILSFEIVLREHL